VRAVHDDDAGENQRGGAESSVAVPMVVAKRMVFDAVEA